MVEGWVRQTYMVGCSTHTRSMRRGRIHAHFSSYTRLATPCVCPRISDFWPSQDGPGPMHRVSCLFCHTWKKPNHCREPLLWDYLPSKDYFPGDEYYHHNMSTSDNVVTANVYSSTKFYVLLSLLWGITFRTLVLAIDMDMVYLSYILDYLSSSSSTFVGPNIMSTMFIIFYLLYFRIKIYKKMHVFSTTITSTYQMSSSWTTCILYFSFLWKLHSFSMF